MTIALLCLLLLLIAILLLRPTPALSTPRLIPASPPPHPLSLQSRQVSFSIVSSNTSYSPDPVQRRWSKNRKPFIPDAPRPPQLALAQKPLAASVDQLGYDVHSPPKSLKPLSTPLRLSFTSKRRSSSASCTSTLIHLDQVDTRATSPLSSTSTTQSPLQRTRFVNPFTKHTRSRTLSPPSKQSHCLFLSSAKLIYRYVQVSRHLVTNSVCLVVPVFSTYA